MAPMKFSCSSWPSMGFVQACDGLRGEILPTASSFFSEKNLRAPLYVCVWVCMCCPRQNYTSMISHNPTNSWSFCVGWESMGQLRSGILCPFNRKLPTENWNDTAKTRSRKGPAGMVLLVKTLKHKLLGGLEHELYDFPYVGNVIIPTDFHIFQSGSNHQPAILSDMWNGDFKTGKSFIAEYSLAGSCSCTLLNRNSATLQWQNEPFKIDRQIDRSISW